MLNRHPPALQAKRADRREARTKPGDLWLLGDHKLLCGDSTKAEDVQRLMAGERAGLMATDPPYLVDYQGGAHPASEANKGAATKDKQWDTYIDHEHSVAFYVEFLRAALDCALTAHAAVYEGYARHAQRGHLEGVA